MIEHTRLAHAQMGIDVWVLHNTPTYFTHNSLYRDQEYIHSSPLTDTYDPLESELTVAPPTDVDSPITTSQEATLTVDSNDSLIPQLNDNVLAPFKIELMRMEHCAVAVNTHDLNEPLMELWHNIKKSLAHEELHLDWPSIMNMPNTPANASAYIKGFLIANCSNTETILLGPLPVSIEHNTLQYPSLLEMFEQPLLKKQLWGKIRNK